MKEDDFLNEYRQEWQQDGKAMEEALSDITLEQLHEGIARHEASRRRRWLWPTVSAAACVALLATFGVRLLSPEATGARHPAVAQNEAPQPPIMMPTDTATPWADEQEGLPTAAREAPSAQRQNDMAMATALPILTEEALQEPEVIAKEEETPTIAPACPSNMVETKRLVAIGGSTAKPRERETELLVNIVPPPRNTFHEAVIEPLLALVTQDLEDY